MSEKGKKSSEAVNLPLTAEDLEGAYNSGFHSGKAESETEILDLKSQILQLESEISQPKLTTPGPEDKVRWRKTGGGSFRMKNGRIIKPNEVFYATVAEIPRGFRDVIVPIDALPEEAPIISATKYELRTRGVGWFDVVNTATGKVENENALRKADAERLLRDLS